MHSVYDKHSSRVLVWQPPQLWLLNTMSLENLCPLSYRRCIPPLLSPVSHVLWIATGPSLIISSVKILRTTIEVTDAAEPSCAMTSQRSGFFYLLIDQIHRQQLRSMLDNHKDEGQSSRRTRHLFSSSSNWSQVVICSCSASRASAHQDQEWSQLDTDSLIYSELTVGDLDMPLW